MSVNHPDQTVVETEHALLIAYGRFAEQIGLHALLEQVPFGMKTLDHSPQDKTVELLAHVLAGGMHITELGHSAHPLVHDTAVAAAFGQEAFASASGVNGLLRAISGETVAAFKTATHRLIDPYRRRILRDLSPSFLVVDLDLTGLVISDQATTYEGADFGYMGEVGGLARGYQFARAQLVGSSDVLVLGGFLHPGRTVSAHCVAELVGMVEAELGRPRRRVDLLDSRLTELTDQRTALETTLAQRQKGPVSGHRRVQHLEAESERLRVQIADLRVRRDALAAENATNPTPRRIILRLDGGFGDAANLAWLYEQGYDFVARAHNHRVAQRLRDEEGLSWQQVSKNGFLAQSTQTTLGACPYPLRVFANRQWWGDSRPERWSALIVTPTLTAADWNTRRVGVFYNGRQVMEAGIKEGKGIFASRHLPTRHQPGIAFDQDVVLLAQNLVRWFRRQFLGHTILAAASVKELVRIGANSRAFVLRRGADLALTFAPDSPWRGITLSIKAQFSYQLWFPILDESAAIRT